MKVKINQSSFEYIQEEAFKHRIYWNGSRDTRQSYKDDMFALYFQKKTKTLLHKNDYLFAVSSAKEVSVEEFVQELKNQAKVE